MQTFLPYKSFIESAKCLDNKRLGKQRVEAMQILKALEPGSQSRWRNHPAVKMWYGYKPMLHAYKDECINEWIARGFKNTMPLTFNLALFEKSHWFKAGIKNPHWLTDDFCQAHRSNLLRKNAAWYSQFNWDVQNDLPYIWPVN